MTSEIEWIENASGEKREARAGVVGWQNSLYSINGLVQTYNSIILNEKPANNFHEPMRIIAARRQVLASLLELKERVDEWIGSFYKAGWDCTSINGVKKSCRAVLNKADAWREIRNLTFHYGDIVEPSNQLLEAYKAIANISDEDVNSVWKAIVNVGQSAKNVALNHT